jgi:hypothetical protein
LNIYPGYRDELKRASQNNLTHEDIRILFELLGVSIPEGF